MNAATGTQQTANLPTITAHDRLGFLLIFSTILHSFIILTVGFHFVMTQNHDMTPTLEVVLVQKKSDETPEEADFIANESNMGGGNVDKKTKRSTPFKAPFENNEANIAFRSGSMAQRQPTADNLQILTTENSRKSIDSEFVEKQKPQPNQNISNVEEMNWQNYQALSDIIDRDLEKYAKRPKREFISASTKKDSQAAYLKAWEAKVERIGNMNYPARVVGQVIVSVRIFRNGQVESVKIMPNGTSGNAVLDNAVKHIIKLASPFQPFSSEVSEADIVHVVRTYIFNGKTFRTRDTPLSTKVGRS